MSPGVFGILDQCELMRCRLLLSARRVSVGAVVAVAVALFRLLLLLLLLLLFGSDIQAMTLLGFYVLAISMVSHLTRREGRLS